MKSQPSVSDRPLTRATEPAKPFVDWHDLADFDPSAALGEPGQFPYTRGVHASMYQHRLWTMRQFAGFGTASDTNRRFKYLLAHGQTGLSTAFDLPTLMGRDGDDPLALGEVGMCGVAVSSLADMAHIVRRNRPARGFHEHDD